jgi:hypothetical protein
MQLARPGAIDSDKLITDTHCTYKPEHCLEGSDVYENACFPIVGASYVRVPGASVGAVAQPVRTARLAFVRIFRSLCIPTDA